MAAARKPSLRSLRGQAHDCRRCHLWKNATQTVFGEGPARARVVLIGETPGDREDLAGRPFVGPAGAMLDKALAEVGIARQELYVTNAVKHFKFERRGKRRIHSKPNAAEQAACRPWLEGELAAIKPEVLVCLGATAAMSLFGKQFRVTTERGQWRELADGRKGFATVHPSSLLRLPDEDREAGYKQFVKDLRLLGKYLDKTQT